MDKDFKYRMNTLLKSKGMTQRQLANELAVSEVTVSRWMNSGEHGRNPSVRTLKKIAEILGTTPDHLLGKGEEQAESTVTGGGVNLGTFLSATALTATAVIGIVALAKAMGKLDEKDIEQIKDILDKK